MRGYATSSLIAWLAAAGIVAAGAWFFWSWVPERRAEQSAARGARLAKQADERNREAQRVARGAVVQSTAEISPGETVTVFLVPWMSSGTFARERMCIVYKNEAFKTARLFCEREDDLLTIPDEP